MTDINELRRLTQAVVKGWGNCDQAWLDQSEDTPAAVVGHIDEDGETYPVATIDCDQYYAGHQSLPLARFYAAANPAAINELLDRLEAAEKECNALRADKATLQQMTYSLKDHLEAAEKERDALEARLKYEAAESEALEEARLNGMGSEREAALLSKLEAAEKERDELRTELEKERKEHSYTLHAAEAEAKQVDRLRAKVESMEKQEPVATTAATHKPGEVGYCTFHKETPFGSTLYALPGAQPALSVPSVEAAELMGAKGGSAVDAERLAFEAWMRGHCWKLGAKWTGTEYRSAFEKDGMVDMHAMRTRELWAAWRDRAALAASPEAKP